MSDPIRVLVVDDSATFRHYLVNLLSQQPGIEVVGQAINGRTALAKIPFYKPDVITLDLEMPVLDGCGVLRGMAEAGIDIPVIMLSGHTDVGVQRTMEALQLGASDFVLKPKGDDAAANAEQLRRQLCGQIQAVMGSRVGSEPTEAPTTRAPAPVRATVARAGPVEMIVVGISTGGPEALRVFMRGLPGDIPVPILVVQHMPAGFTAKLAESLDRISALEVFEGADGDEPRPGTVWFAPGGRQMRLVSRGGTRQLQLTDDPPERSCRPSADYLFRSVAEVVGGGVLAVVMTGMGDDGAIGCELLKAKGAKVMVQDEASSVVWGMPGSVAHAGLADWEYPLESLAGAVAEFCCGRSPCS